MIKSATGLENSPICTTAYYKIAEGMTQNEDLQLAIAWRLKNDDCQAELYNVRAELKETKKAIKQAENKQKTQRGLIIFSAVLAGCLAATVAVLGALR